MSSAVNMVDNSSVRNKPIRKAKEFIDRQNQYNILQDFVKDMI